MLGVVCPYREDLKLEGRGGNSVNRACGEASSGGGVPTQEDSGRQGRPNLPRPVVTTVDCCNQGLHRLVDQHQLARAAVCHE